MNLSQTVCGSARAHAVFCLGGFVVAVCGSNYAPPFFWWLPLWSCGLVTKQCGLLFWLTGQARWCIFELAAFLKSQESQAKALPIVCPTLAGPISVGLFAMAVVAAGFRTILLGMQDRAKLFKAMDLRRLVCFGSWYMSVPHFLNFYTGNQ